MFGAKSTTCPIKLFPMIVQFEKPSWEGLYGLFWGFLGPTCPIKLCPKFVQFVKPCWEILYGLLAGFLGLTCPIKLMFDPGGQTFPIEFKVLLRALLLVLLLMMVRVDRRAGDWLPPGNQPRCCWTLLLMSN